MRIAMLGHKRVPSREGGIEIVVEELSKRMVKMGHAVTLYNRKGHHVSGSEYDGIGLKNYKGIKLKNVYTIDKKGLAAISSSFFAAIAVAFGKYDVVHFHAEGPCMFIWFPKLFGKKCIATIHGLDHQREKWGKFASWYIRTGEKNAVKYADEIIVLSKNIQNYFEQKYNRKTVFIPNGVNQPKILHSEQIKEFNLEKDEYILYLGRIVPEKGIHYLIEAFKKVSTTKKLVIAGGSSNTENYLKHIKQIAEDNSKIIFTGFVQGKLLEELYSNAYLYCLPSDLEGMPLSLLEAMSYGNCCLVSDIEECTSVVNDKAITFKKSDIADLSKKLQYLCDNSELVNQMKSKASQYVCKKYNWDMITQQTLNLYKDNKETIYD